MKLTFAPILLTAFAVLANASTPDAQAEQAKLDQLDELSKGLPQAPGSRFVQEGNHLLSISADNKLLGSKIIEPLEAREASRQARRRGAPVAKRATTLAGPEHNIFARALMCADYPCDEASDCYAYWSITRSGRRFRCNGCDPGLKKCTL
ncbi:uncharacterized protein GGS22DRAFT_197844 [Annulohypoxylon maeteangense]|uniref:uncharacterized protein n=1 Tax=Annulohypoxylon maeteangense TaxID=1927788 RepID=UPI00200775D7|nr:uncharacterized protein GGS22DRAFT_197844 [Annulohypoxylon maeteangense]KAI0887924.1 hypothetical protein GGS22DRAFT_197844 [Annulohypoxylon maeteangense]